MIEGVGAYAIPTSLLFLSTASKSTAQYMWALEVISSMEPAVAIVLTFTKILFRARFCIPFGTSNIDVF